MNFSDLLNKYINEIGCTSKELSKMSNLSEPAISRYRNGERIPKYDSDSFNNIIKGLSLLSNNPSINEETIRKSFDNILKRDYNSFNNFVDNLNEIIEHLKINVADMSRFIGYDQSYISKIRKKERTPYHIDEFINAIYKYIITNYSNDYSKEKISLIMNCDTKDINNDIKYKQKLKDYMCVKSENKKNIVDKLLEALDNFKLNEYMDIIDNDDTKIMSLPFSIPKAKTYYGNKMGEAELDFIKNVVMQKNNEEIFLYSNMPMEQDTDISKKLVKGIAIILKRNIHINIIHNLDRPFNEMIIGLVSWIPLYMTGNISSYYFKSNDNLIYSHLDAVSSTVALTGECITGYKNDSKFYLTNKKDEVSYYRKKAKNLLKKAKPLIEVYNENNKKELHDLIINNENLANNICNYLSSLPVYTISDTLLDNILKCNNLSNEEINKIKIYVQKNKENVNNILVNNTICDYINKQEKSNKYLLSLPELFLEYDIYYTNEQYQEHLNLTEKFMNDNTNYTFKYTNNIFKNINVAIIENKLVIISKEKNPKIHFVIEHPKLRSAIENLEIAKEK